MKLSKKLIGIILFSSLSTIFLVLLVLGFFQIKTFNAIEFDNVSNDMMRVSKYIENYTNEMHTLCMDYSHWDDTYEFMSDQNKNYIRSNFNDAISFVKSGADFIIYADNSGNMVFNKYFNNTKQLYAAEVEYLTNYSLDMFKDSSASGINGLMDIKGRPAFLSINPILKSDGSGPKKGVIICGNFIDNQLLDDIYKSQKVKAEIIPYDESVIKGSLYDQENIHISVISRYNLNAAAVIYDINHKPYIAVRAVVQRKLYMMAERNFIIICVFITLIVLISSLIFFVLARFLVVKRLEEMADTFEKISSSEDLSTRIEVTHNDEITSLGKNFNMMLEKLQKSSEKIYKAAYFDALTGLPNRKKLAEDVGRLITEAQSFSVFYIDLDNFKNINDSLGHDVGDIVLKKIAKILGLAANSNTIVGKIGGDEFILIKKECYTLEDIYEFANKICSALSEPISFKGNEFFIKASMGITTYPEGGTSVSMLMKNADTAMYEAKKSGGSTYKIYKKEMNENSLDKLIMENSLRKALDNNEFFVEYQPIFDCSNLNILGAEVLCRWKLESKIIPPGVFIPIAKRTGEIIKIDNWVLKKACFQCREWQDKELKDFYISVNISFKQLRQSGFTDYVLKVLEESRLDPKYLNLEITEDEAMEDPEYTIKLLNTLKDKNIRISIDDFGTGYSSLSYINRFPLSTIKIDKSLIDNIEEKTNLEIIRSVINLANNLELNVVSEGVEFESQHAILKDLQCKSVQGYLFSKPLSAEKFRNKYINEI